ncbi:hypothetical protein CB0940_07383 [Cercospora beticola]|uniref:Uncharacterized protein n=1 Tax=Cercospora beticola TaxID=122368 RepID=A0A2G5HA11_CERBT|nr:hypothetical protein CB0940_07383 [Cercospora beticola]PIA89357.1 hypothetical protein CB0940_07383 [Cercospora beticola]WPB03325.1 hypothetical protein RHO25_007962 [Cercospora beticola]CAK1357955.1 unnamed protein product [Cercospora beticola]
MNESFLTPGAFGRSGSVMSGPHGSDALFVQDEASDGERPSKPRLAEHDIKGEVEFEVEQPARQAFGLSPPSDDGNNIHQDTDIIDLEDAAEEKYWLEEFKQWLPKVEVEARLKEKYAQAFKRQAGKAMPNTHNKQRMEEIVSCARDNDTTIRYILSRDKKVWYSKLKEAEKALHLEHDEIQKFRDLQKRAEYKHILDEHLITRTKARIQVVEKDLEIRKKVVKEMTKWVKDE